MANQVADVWQGPGDTYQIGGSRFAAFETYAFQPIGYGSTIDTTTTAGLSVPPSYADMTPGVVSASGAVTAASSPWDPRKSPLVWAIVGLVFAVVLLHWLHWSGEE